MNDTTRLPRTADLVALSQATDANGKIDLTAYQAQRLILLHQSIDGLDARALVDELVSSPAYADPQGREQIGPLLDAIVDRLPSTEVRRFSQALDSANVNESWAERNYEHYLETPVSDGIEYVTQSVSDGLNLADQQISDSLAAAKRWAESVRDNPQNSYLERAAGRLAGEGAGAAQDHYGSMKGATSQGLALLGDTIDLAKFAYRFNTDVNFRNVVIGAAAIYASDAAHDPSKPLNDISKAAIGAWNEWEAGLEKATKEGKEKEYLGEAKGAAAIEIIATFVPISKITKLARVAQAVDVTEDLTPAGRMAGRTEGRIAGELAEELVELARDAKRVQARGGLESAGADLAFSGLAGMKRSQGELRELVDGLRKSGDLDGLLSSGALAPKELGYLARRDVTAFDGDVSFEQALTKSIGGRELSALKSGEVGNIGEAIVANNLARKGYTDLVPIQNNSGHGNDLAGINSETGRWEVVEVKASIKGIAKEQGGDLGIITDRLNRAVDARGHWDPKNMWEEQAKATAERIIDETLNRTTGKVDVDPKWARVNIERDAATGELKATPQIEKWKTPAERAQERGAVEPVEPLPKRASLEPDASQAVGVQTAHLASSANRLDDLRESDHPGHEAFKKTLDEVHRMETTRGVPSGPHSEKVAAALAVAAEREGQTITNVEMRADGQVYGIARLSAFTPNKEVSIDPAQVQGTPMEQYAAQWSQARSPHYAVHSPRVDRSDEQSRSLDGLSASDQTMFAKIRTGAPPHISDDHVAHAMLLAKKDGITDAGMIDKSLMVGDKLWVAGITPGFRAAVDVSAPAPSIQETLLQTQNLNQQREQQLALEAAQQSQSQNNSTRGLMA